jgi:catechol 2,3-dioxygenase-like lactoylglutathione lyase family enzyme
MGLQAAVHVEPATAMNVRRVRHIRRNVSKLERAVALYVDALGFVRSNQPAILQDPSGHWLALRET